MVEFLGQTWKHTSVEAYMPATLRRCLGRRRGMGSSGTHDGIVMRNGVKGWQEVGL